MCIRDSTYSRVTRQTNYTKNYTRGYTGSYNSQFTRAYSGSYTRVTRTTQYSSQFTGAGQNYTGSVTVQYGRLQFFQNPSKQNFQGTAFYEGTTTAQYSSGGTYIRIFLGGGEGQQPFAGFFLGSVQYTGQFTGYFSTTYTGQYNSSFTGSFSGTYNTNYNTHIRDHET